MGMPLGLGKSKVGTLLPLCPVCSYVVYRSSRAGWRDSVAKAIGRYPYRCRACKYRFYMARRVT